MPTAKRRNLLLAVSLSRSEFSSRMDSSSSATLVGVSFVRQSNITLSNILRLLPGEEVGMGRGGVGGRPGDSIYMIIGRIKADVGFVTVN